MFISALSFLLVFLQPLKGNTLPGKIPQDSLQHLVGKGAAVFGFLARLDLVAIQLLALAGAVIQETPGAGFWLVLTLGHNACRGVWVEILVRKSQPFG